MTKAPRTQRSRAALLPLYYPELAPLRADPRFAGLARKLGLIDYWPGKGRAPDFCARPDAPPVCAGLR